MGRPATPGARKRKPPPHLLFAADFERSCRRDPLPDDIESLRITNVVLLSTQARTPAQAFRHGLFARGVAPPDLRTNDELTRYSHEPARRRNTHYRIRCGPPLRRGNTPDGKFLLFGTNNIIRAGKHNHADAVASTLRLIRSLKAVGAVHVSAHPSLISCPNTVVTGRNKSRLCPTLLRQHWRSHSSSRFPGVAVNITDGTIVPEVYPTDNRYIMPGVVSPEQLHAGAAHLAATLHECRQPPS